MTARAQVAWTNESELREHDLADQAKARAVTSTPAKARSEQQAPPRS